MAMINVLITKEEKDSIVEALKRINKGQTLSVAQIAKEAAMNPNRARFVVEELLDEERIERMVTKQYNPRYIRYSYKVIK